MQLAALNCTVAGKDKTYRLAQYLCKLVAAGISGMTDDSPFGPAAIRLRRLSAAIGLSRKRKSSLHLPRLV